MAVPGVVQICPTCNKPWTPKESYEEVCYNCYMGIQHGTLEKELRAKIEKWKKRAKKWKRRYERDIGTVQ